MSQHKGPAQRDQTEETYETVGKVLDRVKRILLKLRDQLQEDGWETDERTVFVRRSIRDATQQNVVALTTYRRDGDPSMLETWLQYSPAGEAEEVLEETDLSGPLDPDELVARKARFDQALIDFYKHLARETSIPRIEDMFTQMARQAEQQVSQQSWRFRDADTA